MEVYFEGRYSASRQQRVSRLFTVWFSLADQCSDICSIRDKESLNGSINNLATTTKIDSATSYFPGWRSSRLAWNNAMAFLGKVDREDEIPINHRSHRSY